MNSRRAMPMIVAVAVALAMLGGVAAIVLSGGGDDETSAPSGDGAAIADSGQSVPDVTFIYFDGGEGTFEDFEGKPTVVNFFASWCGPCILEMPDIEEVFQDYCDEVNFVGFDTQDDIEDGRNIVAETGVTYTLASDPDGSIYRAFEGFGMPTTVFISAKGEIVDMHTGLLQGDALLSKIEQEFLS